MTETTVIQAQPGPQEAFLSTDADIAVYGGAAFSGKSYALLMEPLRHVNVKNFGAVIFRRERPEITSEGGLWDTSFQLYMGYDCEPIQSPKLHWRFATGSKITFSHLQHEKHLKSWQGSQIPLIGFDELTHFTEKMFFYMLSRNRSMCGVKPYIRATTNPDPDSWLCKFLLDAGYINKDTGYPIYEMSGIVKFFVRDKGHIVWGDTREDLKERFPDTIAKSFTFIPATFDDNKIGLEADPGYEGNLDALLEYEMLKLKKGNWFARPTAGELFKRRYFKLINKEDLPSDFEERIRYWDRAATTPNDKNPDPDYTCGLQMVKDIHEEKYYIMDVVRDRCEPGDVESMLIQTTDIDNYDSEVLCGFEQDPAQAGKFEVASYENKLGKLDLPFKAFPKTKAMSKLTCWLPVARAAKNGHVYIVKGPWNEEFLKELEAVTDGTQDGHDDQADCLAGAYNYLYDSQQGFFGSLPNTI